MYMPADVDKYSASDGDNMVRSQGLKDRDLAAGWKIALTLFILGICAAVCFVKQHSAIDVAAALPVSLLAEIILFGRDYWLPKLRGEAA